MNTRLALRQFLILILICSFASFAFANGKKRKRDEKAKATKELNLVQVMGAALERARADMDTESDDDEEESEELARLRTETVRMKKRNEVDQDVRVIKAAANCKTKKAKRLAAFAKKELEATRKRIEAEATKLAEASSDDEAEDSEEEMGAGFIPKTKGAKAHSVESTPGGGRQHYLKLPGRSPLPVLHVKEKYVDLQNVLYTIVFGCEVPDDLGFTDLNFTYLDTDGEKKWFMDEVNRQHQELLKKCAHYVGKASKGPTGHQTADTRAGQHVKSFIDKPHTRLYIHGLAEALKAKEAGGPGAELVVFAANINEAQELHLEGLFNYELGGLEKNGLNTMGGPEHYKNWLQIREAVPVKPNLNRRVLDFSDADDDSGDVSDSEGSVGADSSQSDSDNDAPRAKRRRKDNKFVLPAAALGDD